MTSECPDCDRLLPPGATVCRCGWEVKAHVSPDIARAATIAQIADREKREVQKQAEETCKRLGLNSVDEMRKYFREGFKTWARRNEEMKRD
jgi:hypothetical protein